MKKIFIMLVSLHLFMGVGAQANGRITIPVVATPLISWASTVTDECLPTAISVTPPAGVKGLRELDTENCRGKTRKLLLAAEKLMAVLPDEESEFVKGILNGMITPLSKTDLSLAKKRSSLQSKVGQAKEAIAFVRANVDSRPLLGLMSKFDAHLKTLEASLATANDADLYDLRIRLYQYRKSLFSE